MPTRTFVRHVRFRSRNGSRRVCEAVSAFLAILLLSAIGPPVAAAAPKHVLIVRGESPDLPGQRILVDALDASLRTSLASPVDLYIETIDTGRFPGEVYERRLGELFAEKYRDRRLDLVVALGAPAVEFVIRERATFGGAPFLLGLIERRAISEALLPRQAAVAYVQTGALETLKLAFQALPSARRALVVGGSSRFDRGWMRVVQEDLRAFDGRVPIEYDTESSVEALTQKVQGLSPDTVIFYVSMTRDGDGNAARPVNALDKLRASTTLPIFGFATTYLDHGIVGGALMDFERHGVDLGRQALRVMAGERPPPLTTPVRNVVDWREMQRHGIAVAALPATVAVAFHEPTRWERQKSTILTAGFVVALETALIVALFWNGRRRRDVQERLEIRLRYERLLSEIAVSLAATPPRAIEETIHLALARVAETLRIHAVWLWDGSRSEDGGWQSWRVTGGEPEWFPDPTSLPLSIQTRLSAEGVTSCSSLAVPLMAGDPKAGVLFAICVDARATWAERGGELGVLAAVLAAVLQRKRVEIALEDSDRFKGAILDSLPAHVAVVDRDGVVLATNGARSPAESIGAFPTPSNLSVGVNYLDVWGTAVAAGVSGSRDAEILIEQACRGERTERQVEFRAVTPGGEHWFLITAEPLRGAEGGAVVTHWEITERKLNELALRESEDRFRKLADAMPVPIWVSDVEGGRVQFNRQWLQMTGRALEDQVGDAWLESVYPEDRPGCMDLYLRSFHARETFRMEYRITRHDGIVRWLLDSGTPRYGNDGAFHGFVGGCFDITEQKEAEHLLRDLSHRLMRAQDEERRRIARELHDHLSQQLALLAVDLQMLAVKHIPKGDLAPALQEAWRRTTEISSDVHAISHRLHPSKMEALGLVATANGHCRDISRQSLPVHFQHADVPSGIPPDRALSVFRILEEALTNVVRHSGATEARVMLHGTGTHIVLRVADNGRGFIEPTRSAGGLGLASMRERLQLLEGTLSITSVPAKGTVVEARIPLAHASDPRGSADHSSHESLSRTTLPSTRNFAGSA